MGLPAKEGVGELLRRARQPGVGDQLSKVRDADAIELEEDRRVAVEVRGGEVDRRIVCDERMPIER